MVQIALVEDSQRDRKELVKFLERYQKEHHITFKIVEFTDGEDIVSGYMASYDIILMDIEMMFMNGMKAAEQIRMLDKKVVIIFITNAPQYAIKGYKVRALDYVIKPVSYFSFCETMNRALAECEPEETKYLVLSVKGGKMKLDISEICYVEVQDHVLIYHTKYGVYETKGTIRDVEEQLNMKEFFRCNRCYVVNLGKIQNYRGNDIMVNGDIIQVSRSRRKAFLDALNLYISEE